MPLKYMIKTCPIMRFEISTHNLDGSRKTDTQMGHAKQPAQGKKGQLSIKGGKTNAQKIQGLLDQRKPPTEKLQSLCAEYDEELNKCLDVEI
jgi:hypothetical protein